MVDTNENMSNFVHDFQCREHCFECLLDRSRFCLLFPLDRCITPTRFLHCWSGWLYSIFVENLRPGQESGETGVSTFVGESIFVGGGVFGTELHFGVCQGEAGEDGVAGCHVECGTGDRFDDDTTAHGRCGVCVAHQEEENAAAAAAAVWWWQREIKSDKKNYLFIFVIGTT